MKYTYLKVFWGFANGVGVFYELPIIADQELYNAQPAPTGTWTLYDEGDDEGYYSLDNLLAPVTKKLGFNPFMLAAFNINAAGVSYKNGFIPDVIHAFMGEVLEPTNRNGAFIYPDKDGTSFTGGNYAEGYSTNQAGLGATVYGGGAYDIPFINVMVPLTKFSSNDGITYTFEFWPETVIEQGYFNTQHFNYDEGNIRSCQLRINIWLRNDRYFYEIYVRSFNYSANDTSKIRTALEGEETGHIYNPANPMDNKQQDGTEGGTGGFDDDSDPVDVPALPTLDISDLGGINLYRVTAGDVKTLMAYLNSATPGDAILKWFTNPIQAIVSLHVLPYPVSVIGSGAIKILGLEATGTAGYKIKQFQEWDLGGVHVDYGFGNNFLDYEPFTKCQIYLPFIGIRQLDMDEVAGSTVSVVYQFDNVSGACIAFITINGAVRYTFSGSCAIGIPISQSNWGQTYMAAATVAAGAITGGVSAGAGAMAGATSAGAVAGQAALGAGQGIATASGLGSSIGKPSLSRSGSISGAASALGVPYPYLIIERPEQAKVANPAPVIGLMSGRTLPLSSLSGYNIIENVHLHGIAATGEELQEIERLLYEGVVF